METFEIIVGSILFVGLGGLLIGLAIDLKKGDDKKQQNTILTKEKNILEHY
jgi:hypothetical protein